MSCPSRYAEQGASAPPAYSRAVKTHMAGRGYGVIYRYLTREFLLGFAVAFLFFFVIFFVNQLLLLAEDILTKNVPALDVARLVFYSLPSIIALAFPFGALVGALLSVGRLSQDNEFLAIRAAGISLTRAFIPFAVLGLAFSSVSFVMNDYFLPVGTINFARLYRELLYSNPDLELESNSVTEYQDSIIVTGSVEGNRISDLVIIDRDGTDDRVILSRFARLRPEEHGAGVVSLELEGVTTHEAKRSGELRYQYSHSDRMAYHILLGDITLAMRSPGPREMSSYDLAQEINEKLERLDRQRREHRQRVEELQERLQREEGELEEIRRRAAEPIEPEPEPELELEDDLKIKEAVREAAELESAVERSRRELERERGRTFFDRSLQLYRIEFHKKFAIPFACFAFVIFAFPVGVVGGRHGRSIGFGIGLFIAVLYWALILGGQTFGVEPPYLSPVLAMWFPNILVGAVGALVFFAVVRR